MHVAMEPARSHYSDEQALDTLRICDTPSLSNTVDGASAVLNKQLIYPHEWTEHFPQDTRCTKHFNTSSLCLISFQSKSQSQNLGTSNLVGK